MQCCHVCPFPLPRCTAPCLQPPPRQVHGSSCPTAALSRTGPGEGLPPPKNSSSSAALCMSTHTGSLQQHPACQVHRRRAQTERVSHDHREALLVLRGCWHAGPAGSKGSECGRTGGEGSACRAAAGRCAAAISALRSASPPGSGGGAGSGRLGLGRSRGGSEPAPTSARTQPGRHPRAGTALSSPLPVQPCVFRRRLFLGSFEGWLFKQ